MTTPTNHRIGLFSQTKARISSFDQKPENGGTPAIASQPTMKQAEVIGITLRSAPMWRMSWSSCMPWMTEPALRNSSPLKKAWVIMWKTAAT